MPEPKIVALTGAGISAESGVPTFRGEGGLWRGHRAQDLATPQAFQRDRAQVWAFYHYRRQLVDDCHPNPAHRILAEIESQLATRFTLITQNVDGLHRLAGNQNLIEIHGSLWQIKCSRCQQSWQDRQIYPEDALPTCPNCEQVARPDVVWFGEGLDPALLEKSFEAVKSASIMLVIGTSAVVYPAAQLPVIAKQNGARLIEFNLEPTPLSQLADETYFEPAGSSLPRWWNQFIHS
jgi:NAD-dependent deacetylase